MTINAKESKIKQNCKRKCARNSKPARYTCKLKNTSYLRYGIAVQYLDG